MPTKFTGKVFCMDSLRLLQALPTESIDGVISDPMYGVKKGFEYDSCRDEAGGNPHAHWDYHEPYYRECLRVLRPGGILAWAQGGKFVRYFDYWFGGHRVWTLTRYSNGSVRPVGNVWVVQTKEQRPVEFPTKDSLISYRRSEMLRCKHHPCPKPVEEMSFLVESLTQPGEIVLDCFCGVGSTLAAAQQLDRRWIGCDLSQKYCQIAMARIEAAKSALAVEPKKTRLLSASVEDLQ